MKNKNNVRLIISFAVRLSIVLMLLSDIIQNDWFDLTQKIVLGYLIVNYQKAIEVIGAHLNDVTFLTNKLEKLAK